MEAKKTKQKKKNTSTIIKDSSGRLLVNHDERKNRQREYFNFYTVGRQARGGKYELKFERNNK